MRAFCDLVEAGRLYLPAGELAPLGSALVVTGLKAGTTMQFRYRSVVKGGAGNWSQTVSLLVP